MIFIKKIGHNGLILTVKELAENKIMPGNEIEIKKIPSTKEYKTYLKLLGLWELLLKELKKHTGYSTEWWKIELKMRSGYGDVVTGPGGIKRFIPRSMAWEKSTKEQRTKLFKESFSYIQEKEIIDLTEFINDYYKITGKENII